MLRLNPGDNQGLRYLLLGHYLETGDLAGARRLFAEYDEGSTVFTWGLVLERYLSGDLAGAVEALRIARRQNPYVEPYLTGSKRMRKDRPEYLELGEGSEAEFCMDTIGRAWARHREAVQWVRKAVLSL